MKKFKFKLNKVLEVRELEEEEAQNKLLAEQKKAREIESNIISLEKSQEKLYQSIRDSEGKSMQENIAYRNFIQNNRQKIKETERTLLIQEQEVFQSRENYLEKKKKKEVLEKIKEKEYKKYYTEFLIKEQKELDEMALNMKGLEGV
ncbi:flagellar export protein FliJ [Natronospora cellulosivora (SeqCode)]